MTEAPLSVLNQIWSFMIWTGLPPSQHTQNPLKPSQISPKYKTIESNKYIMCSVSNDPADRRYIVDISRVLLLISSKNINNSPSASSIRRRASPASDFRFLCVAVWTNQTRPSADVSPRDVKCEESKLFCMWCNVRFSKGCFIVLWIYCWLQNVVYCEFTHYIWKILYPQM